MSVMDAHFAVSSRLILFLKVAKFAIETIGLIGQSGAFYQIVINSGAVKMLNQINRHVALLIRLGYCLTLPSIGQL